MKKVPTPEANGGFRVVEVLGRTLPDVEVATKYDGSPILKVAGRFMAGLANHPSAEPGTLVVRAEVEHRACLIEDAPETYYLTEHYERHPVVLVRLVTIGREALRDLLMMSRRLTIERLAVKRS